MAKIQPSVLSIQFVVGESQTKFLDISQAASICNRRFYRQGLNWVVAGFTISTGPIGAAPASGVVTISKVPTTWCASNAWHKAYAHQKSQQDDAVDEAGGQSAVAKFRDFKVHANTDHVDAGFGNNLIPVDASGASFLTGEWQASQIVLPNVVPDASGSEVDPQEYFLHMVGDNNHGGLSRGVIDGYASSRAFPQSPDPVGPNLAGNENWFMQMENVGNESPEVIDNATNRNDDLPYDQDEYPGGAVNAPFLEIVHEQTFVQSTSTTTRKLSGTTVPCGLLQITNGVPGPIDLFLHLVPGPARGYLTQPMQDM